MQMEQMFRLVVVSSDSEEVVVKLDGWLAGANVDLLQREVVGYLQESSTLVLDLEGVRSIDRSGLRLLQRWAGGRLVLRGGSLFLDTLLRAHGLDQETLRR
jgi:anti-anti-sigma factor